ncbi:hypothetical protein LTR85_010348 [Meristemomyces frigidus]|nr:hypothetical protein LTR85_010348 [Meristemomyces frigidus]
MCCHGLAENDGGLQQRLRHDAGLDIYVLVEEFISAHPVRQMVKAVVYGIKLKLEFAVLSQLVDITTESRDNFGSYKQNAHLQSGAEDGAVREERGTAAHSSISEKDVETAGGNSGTAGWPANERYVEDPLTFHTAE